MKRYILPMLLFAMGNLTYGQSKYQKLPSLGIHFFVNDFETAAELRATNLSSVLENDQFTAAERMNPGLALSYLKGVGNHIDINLSLAGSFVDYDVPNTGKAGEKKFFVEAAFTGNHKLLSDKHMFSPFITLGIGGYMYRSTFGAFIPAGAGLQLKLARDIFVLANAQYRMPVTDKAVYHFYYSLGITAPLVSRKEPVVIPPPPPVVVLDRDADGILDADDKCPDTPGLASLQGCPDRDGDGITDAEDKCPDVAGLIKYSGCPIPDTDGDGINDELDKCPDVKGFARYEGCPVPDTDGDGVNDEEDKCPKRFGQADNFGCPVIGIKSYEIVFKSGSAILLPQGKNILDSVVRYLKIHDAVNVTIDGHTDNTGSDKINDPLSLKRAEATKTYMASKGIDASRMTTAGFGSKQPVEDNKTATGRKKNRRIEIKIKG